MILHVSTAGQKRASGIDGRHALPGIQEAYDKLVEIKKRGQLDGPSRIWVHQGDYLLDAPLHFYSDLPVEILPWRNGRVTISGAYSVSGWRKAKLNGKSVLCAELPDHIRELPFLYINGKLATAARYPKNGFFRVQDEDKNGLFTTQNNYDSFYIKKGDFNPQWYDPQNISIRMIHLWCEENLGFEAYDAEDGRIITSSGIHFISRNANTEYAFYNVREALSEPGEYYFDRHTRKLWYLPECSTKAFTAAIPVCGPLVRVDSGAKWLQITGLTFQGGGAYMPVYDRNFDLRDRNFAPLGNPACQKEFLERRETFAEKPFYQAAQGAVQLPGVLLFNNVSDCKVSNCEITASSWYGICAAAGCQNLVFHGNHIHEMGGGGIFICGASLTEAATSPQLQNSKIIVTGNHIHACGKRFLSAVGIMLTNAWGCLIEDNHIHDLYYSGISCGYEWGYAPSITREIRIGRNHIHDLGKGILSDMGGIYTLGVQPGTRIYENTIHGIESRYYGGWGLYTDEGSAHIVLEHNLVYDCSCEGFHQNYGRENIVRNNIFAFNRDSGIALNRDGNRGIECPGEPHAKAFLLVNNVIITDGTPAIRTGNYQQTIESRKIYSESNIFFDVSGKQKVFAFFSSNEQSCTFKQWQELGFDRHSIRHDPGFIDLKKLDFHLKPDSILKEYGFDDCRTQKSH
jgi:hypothetical protein